MRGSMCDGVQATDLGEWPAPVVGPDRQILEALSKPYRQREALLRQSPLPPLSRERARGNGRLVCYLTGAVGAAGAAAAGAAGPGISGVSASTRTPVTQYSLSPKQLEGRPFFCS